MKQIYILFLVLLTTTSTINAQDFKSGSLTDNKNQIIDGRIVIDNSEKKIFFKNDGKIKTYNFNSIINATVSGRLYSKIDFENNVYLAHQLVSGKATLYDLSNSTYLTLKEDGLGKLINLEENKAQTPGILALLFNDCNEIRDAIPNSDAIDERILIAIVTDYNNCTYSDYTPTENEIKKTNTFNTDMVNFYAGFQTGMNNITINEFDSNNTTGFGLGLGIAASPAFTGNLQGNLYFDFDVSMIFTGDNDFNNQIDQALNYKANSIKFSIGMEYIFNKKGTLQPFLGIGYGYTSDYYKGTIGTINFKDNAQNYFFIPKVGMLYQLSNNKHIGLTVSYFTEYQNDLSFRYGENLTYYPLVIETSAVTIGLNYYF